MNLTAIVDYQEAQVKHFLGSLTVAMVIPEDVKANGRLVDIGSGGGFPGMPLKVAFSGMHVTVVDSVSKKAGFMDHLAQTLGLDGFEVCAGRAEDLAQDSRLRESFDVVVSRGVAAMRILNGAYAPLLSRRGDSGNHEEGEFQLRGGSFAPRHGCAGGWDSGDQERGHGWPEGWQGAGGGGEAEAHPYQIPTPPRPSGEAPAIDFSSHHALASHNTQARPDLQRAPSLSRHCGLLCHGRSFPPFSRHSFRH